MIIIGHRGARGLAPENTLAAVRKAIACKADAIEFDLRVTNDEKVILSHEAFINSGGEQLRIAGSSYDDLLKAKPNIATFEEALKTVDRKAKLYIEVKPAEPVAPIVKIIKKQLAAGWPASGIALGSFSQKTLLELHRELPDIDMIVIESWSGVRARRRARQVGTRFISMNHLWLWPGFIKAMSLAGYKLYTYTLNNPRTARRWQRFGLYGVVTDYPDRFIN